MEPDGLLGAIIASESLGMTQTLVDGAGGCRSRAQIVLHELIQEYIPVDPSRYASGYFSRQSRMPCTYLNGDDLVFGARDKVADGFRTVTGSTGSGAALLDTLGASLLCTDTGGLEDGSGKGPVTVDGDLSAMSFREGYDAMTASILEDAVAPSDQDGSVNILGYGIQDIGWRTGEAELRRLLGAMGVRVNAVPGCMPTSEEVGSMGMASLNVMLRPELCGRTADALRRITGAEALRLSMGAPVGYAATRSLVREVAEALDRDPAPALAIVDADEREVRGILTNYERLPLGLHARGFSADGESSTVYPLLRWMHGTFGMAPRRIACTDGEYSGEIRRYLEEAGFDDPEMCSEGESEVVFTDGLSALRGDLDGGPTAFVEVRMPRGRKVDLMGRCLIGTAGCRYILDSVFNGIRRFRCGQPAELDLRPCGGR